MPDPVEQTDPIKPPAVIPLEYAMPSTRRQSSRLIGVFFSLVVAGLGVTLEGIGFATMVDAVAHARWWEIVPSAVSLTSGGILCGVAWLIQWRWVCPK